MERAVRKLVIYSMVGIMQLGIGATALASPHHYDSPHEEQRYDRQDQDHDRSSMPFKWHERRENFKPAHHRMDRIADRHFDDRFPGMHPYRWHDRRGEGFLYHGHRVTDAVFFYDDSDELVSIGFTYNGAFIRINADGGDERSDDSFFLAWMRNH